MAAGLPSNFSERLVAVGGDTGRLIAAKNWAATSLGPIGGWPQSLRTAVSTLLMSPVPIVMLWGEDGVMLYNDAYSVFAGGRHPELLGSKVRDGWPEVADFNDNVMKVGLVGGTLAYRDQELTLYRHGRPEQVFMNLDYSPVLDERGCPAGVLAIVVETTDRVASERALKVERDRSQGVLDSVAEGFVLLDRDFQILDINAAGLRMDGRSREEIVGQSHWEAFPASVGTPVETAYRRVMEERVPVELEHRYLDPAAGYDIWLDIRAYPAEAGLALFYRDVTDRRRAEEALRAERDRKAEILESISDAFYAVDSDWRFTYVNQKAEEWWSRGADDLVGKVYWDEFPQAVGSETYEAHQRAMRERAPVRLETASSISNRWVGIDIHPTAGGGLSVYFRDITDRKHADDLRRESEARLAAIFADATVGLSEVDLDGRFLRVNEELCRLLGRGRNELLRLGIVDVTHPDDVPASLAAVEQAVRSGKTASLDKRYRQPDGETVWANSRVTRLPIVQGEPGKLLVVTVDLTERMAAEQRVRESEARFRKVLEIGTVSVVFFDMVGGITDANDAFLEMIGYTRAELEAGEVRYEKLTPPDWRWRDEQTVAELKAAGESIPFEKQYTRKDGQRIWIYCSGKMLDEQTAVEFIVDVTERKRAEERLRASEEFNTRILASSADCIKVLDLEGHVEFMSEGGMCVMEVDDFGAIEGACWPDFWQGEERPKALAAVEAARHGGTGRFQGFATTLKGSPRWWDVIVTAIDGPDGSPEKLLSVSRDVTATREAEERVREGEARYRQIVEGAEDFAIVTLDEQGVILSWNTGAERIVGYSEQEAVGRPGAIIFTPEDCKAGAPNHELNRATSAGRAVNERWHVKKDGTRFWGSGLTMRLDQEGGGYLKLFRDRTAEHEAEASLRESEAALAAEVEALSRLQEVSTRLVADEASRAVYDAILEAAADLMGSECASLQMLDAAGDLQLLAHRGYDARSAAYWQTVDASSQSTCGIALTQKKRVVVPDVEDSGLAADSGDLQSYRWTGMRAVQTTPLLTRSGKPLGMLSTHWKRPHTPSERDLKLFDVLARQAADVIERTAAQAELRESEGRQAFLLSLSDALRALKTPKDIASAAAERLGERFRLNRVFYAELVGSLMKIEHDYTRGVGSIAGEHDLAAFGPEMLSAYHERSVVKVDDVRTDERFSEEARSAVLARQIGAYVDVVLFEEEQRVSLLALQSGTPRTWTSAEEDLFREVGERVRAAIERARAEEQLRELNETLERRVAEASADLDRVWRNASDMFVVIDSGGNFRRINPATTAILGWTEAEMLGRSVFEFIHPEDAAPSTDALEHARMDVLQTFENRYRAKDGSLRTISWTAAPEGALIYAYGRDVTVERERQAELEGAQEALRQSQKMEAMGQLTGGVAHDFNNLLTPIVGSLDMLQRKGLGGEREQRLIAGAAQSAERAKTLVQRLLAFARRQPLQPVPVDVSKLVHGMGDLISSTTGPQIRVLVEAPDDLPPAKADPNQLEMALLNLSVNARDAMPDNGTLRISASAEDVVPGHRSKLRPGTYICLSVADTGSGMDEATISRAVEPFFSTKGVGKGTGLGLSMVHGLASQLGGALTIQSRIGLGTNVELWLPLSENAPDKHEQVPNHMPLPAGRGTALLVDDEEFVRMSTADMLNDLGYRVIEAASAEEAFKLVEKGERFDLLITDHLMPGMNGTDLARAIRGARPGVLVLLVSGYAEREGIEADIPRLSKPFRKDELATSLAQLSNAVSTA